MEETDPDGSLDTCVMAEDAPFVGEQLRLDARRDLDELASSVGRLVAVQTNIEVNFTAFPNKLKRI